MPRCGAGTPASWALGFALASACAAPGCSAAGPQGAALDEGEELPGGETTASNAFGVNAFIRPIENLGREHSPMFYTGNSYFNQSWVEPPSSTDSRDGLGPLFNARSCSSCHPHDGRGAPPKLGTLDYGGLLLRLSVPGQRGEHGEPMPHPIYGGQLQPFAVDGVPYEGRLVVRYEMIAGEYGDGQRFSLLSPSYALEDLQYGPLGAVSVSPRIGPAVIGLGLLEALPEERLTELADPEDLDGDGISGRINRVWDVEAGAMAVGRFGWKAEQPSLRQQSAGAFLGDLGVTSSLFPQQECSEAQPECASEPGGGEPELSDRLLDRVELYAQVLAVPARREYESAPVLEGKAAFTRMGCAGCHTPSHRTSAQAPLAELRDQLIWPYTDLLLHDMGPGLADDRPAFDADGSEWRTPPLWGVGRFDVVNGHERLLHDGRARGVAEAILWHGGEAQAARDAFASASAARRDAVVRFVRSL